MTTQSQAPKQPTAPVNAGTHWRKVHRRQNENLLFAEDLGGLKSVDVEIVGSGVTKAKTSDGKGKSMPYLEFRGKKKVLGLNATNCKAMEAITGTGIVETWRGWITLTVVRTKYKDIKTGRDEETDAIRIAPRRPKGKAGAQNETTSNADDTPPPDEHTAGLSHLAQSEPDEEERRLIEQAEREGGNG